MHLACCFSGSSFLKLWGWGALADSLSSVGACRSSRNLHPKMSIRARGPCSTGGAGTAANQSFGPRHPVDLTAAAQLDFPCPMLNFQCRMLEHLLAGLFKHGLAENRAAEPCPCSQEKGQQALGMTRAAAAAAETGGAAVLAPPGGPGWDKQCPVPLGV